MFVKICGTTSAEDALLAVALGADAIGFVFAPSKRRVDAATVEVIVRDLPPGVVSVGVFRDEHPDTILDIVRTTRIGAVQLHGRETPGEVNAIRRAVPIIIGAFTVDDPRLDRLDDYDIDAVLLDAATPGSGEAFDWARVGDLPSRRRVILAGGLTPENVGDAVEQVRPWGVDVATGVESDPGRKDPLVLQRFISNARSALSEFSIDPGAA